ncbi:hypothetical protein [Opitutus sp. ER46]|uniref:hypothetical protein n=1 Tax=Opitutus sp. ER46 TaxID=2161864 RepID=UPI000D2F833F|nr:hypothetical protein [Opitutus sp. ER46]PTX98912.1 hypothetical protein DB354_02480 [Opitutus sp. ER46]
MKTHATFVTKDQFVALLRDSGVSEAQMDKLHRLFEQRHPEAHQAFLEALQIDAETAAKIRVRSR